MLLGTKFADMVTVAPAESDFGREIPLAQKPAPCTDPELMVSADVPGFLIVTAMLLLMPMPTEPKLTEVGLKERVGPARATCGRRPETMAQRSATSQNNLEIRPSNELLALRGAEVVSGETVENRFRPTETRDPNKCMPFSAYGRTRS